MGKPLNLLIIEDSEDDALLAVRELRKGGFDPAFTRVGTPQELESALDSDTWDAIVSDYNLPGFSGLDALRTVQAKGLGIPFILVSGAIGEELAAEVMKAGAHDYISKGNYARLAQSLERELREAAVRHERRQTAEELTRYREHLEELVRERTAELENANKLLNAEIIERKRMEAELEHFASFPLLNPTPIMEMDADGRVTFCNRAAEKMLGKVECLESSNPLIPRDLPDILRDLHEKKVRQYHRTVEVGELVFDEMIYLAPQFNSVRIFAMDITERRRLEEDRSRLAAIVRSSDDAIIAKTLDGIITDWNKGAEKLYGYTAHEMKGRHISTLVPADRPDELPQILERIGRGEDVENIETIRVAKDGRQIPVLLAISPIRDMDGRITGASSIAHDITERKRAQEKIEELNANLTERAAELALANQELEAFNYTVAHDLRKPLTVINGYCQALKESCGNLLDVHCKEYLQEAYNGTLRMNQLIDALLSFSRLAHVEPRRETVDLSAMAQAVATELRLTEPDRRVEFRITDGLRAEGDAALLRVVLDNFLGNAWKYTGTRDEGIIEFGTTDVDGKPAWFVRDNGAGFDMEDADKLFLPFQRLPGAEEFRGHGIGLATVERIISRHGGRVWAEGEPGKGATFWFTLSAD